MSVDTDLRPPATRPGRPAAVLGWLRGLELFVERAPRRPSLRQVLLAVAAVVAGTVVSLLRTRGPGALNTIWAEDASNFLADAFNLGTFDAVTRSFNGYWHAIPRLLAEGASLAPIDWAPAVLSAEAALVTSLIGLFVYIASGAFFRQVPLRLLAAVPVTVAPVAIGWVENNVATLQFPLMYALFWLLLFVPTTRWGRIAMAIVVPLIALTTALAVLLLPLAVLRAIVRRDRWSWLVTVLLAAGSFVQLAAPYLGGTSRAGIGAVRLNPAWALFEYLTKGLPAAIFGDNWTYESMGIGACPQFYVPHHAEHAAVVAASWAVVVTIVVVALRRAARPAWALAVLAGGYSVLIYSASTMLLGCSANRYFVAPALLLLTAMAALLRTDRRPARAPDDGAPGDDDRGDGTPGDDDGQARSRPWLGAPVGTVAVIFLTLVTIVIAANLRTDRGRSGNLPWRQQVQIGREECQRTGEEQVKVVIQPIFGGALELNCSVLVP